MDRHGGGRLGARGHPRGDCHSSRSRGRPRRRMRKRGPTGICEWLRKHRRRSRALRSTACLLRSHALRPTPAPERHRVCQLQRPVGQRSRVQLSPLRMGLTVAVTGPTGEIGISTVTALEDDVDVDRIVGMARRPFKPASHGWTKTTYRRGDIMDRRPSTRWLATPTLSFTWRLSCWDHPKMPRGAQTGAAVQGYGSDRRNNRT